MVCFKKILVGTYSDRSGFMFLYALPDGRGRIVFRPSRDDEPVRWWNVPDWRGELLRVEVVYPFGMGPRDIPIPGRSDVVLRPKWEPVPHALKALRFDYPFPILR
jgi:hypothetical protein